MCPLGKLLLCHRLQKKGEGAISPSNMAKRVSWGDTTVIDGDEDIIEIEEDDENCTESSMNVDDIGVEG